MAFFRETLGTPAQVGNVKNCAVNGLKAICRTWIDLQNLCGLCALRGEILGLIETVEKNII